jgi:Transmembrane proteins 230/134
VTGFLAALLPIEGLQSAVFFIAGAICFIPGAYHVVYIYLAVKGWQGFDFYHLPLFN